MEDQIDDKTCPECDGAGHFTHVSFGEVDIEEYDEECLLCCGKGVIE